MSSMVAPYFRTDTFEYKMYKDPLVLIQEYIFKPKNHIANFHGTFMINVYHTFGHRVSIRLNLPLQTT